MYIYISISINVNLCEGVFALQFDTRCLGGCCRLGPGYFTVMCMPSSIPRNQSGVPGRGATSW